MAGAIEPTAFLALHRCHRATRMRTGALKNLQLFTALAPQKHRTNRLIRCVIPGIHAIRNDGESMRLAVFGTDASEATL